MSNFNTDWVNHIDWTEEKTYEDLGKLFADLSKGFLSADVSSRTNDLVDGRTKQYVLARMVELAVIMQKHNKWLSVRSPRNYTPRDH